MDTVLPRTEMITVETPDSPFFLPRGRPPAEPSSASSSMPRDLREQAASRLRVVALVYSAVFFLTDLLPMLVMSNGDLAYRMESPARWLPMALSVFTGFVVAFLASSRNLSWDAKVNLGLIFQVVASYGIAIDMYGTLSPGAEDAVRYVHSPTWIAIWMIAYAIVVPAPPRRALAALIGSASAPVLLLWMAFERLHLTDRLQPASFFFSVIFPYLICLGIAYVGARTVYHLGRAISRARELGSYRLVEQLGAGGMGEVWRASHQLLARDAAIKFIRADRIAASSGADRKRSLQRFELEAHTTASLSSPHTVSLYDFGIAEDGVFYYVMELLDGIDCDRLVRRFGALSPERVVYLLKQVCESLEEAHAKGLVHRDIKPANIHLGRSGMHDDFVKVLDFGLVVHRMAAPGSEFRMTQPNHAVGTPEFMAPELARGEDADGRTDLYGLGCVGYWLLTAQPVFAGQGLYEVISSHLRAVPDPPSTRVGGAIPAELDALILRCLEKQPGGRPASAREVRTKLEAIPLAEPWSEDRATAWWNANLGRAT